jgi:hypothetical protein
MPSVPTPPATPPAKPTAPAAPAASAPLPEIQKPKLNFAERRALNNALESAQEWVTANEAAVRAQSHALLERVLKPVTDAIAKAHPALDDAIGWVSQKLAAAKF